MSAPKLLGRWGLLAKTEAAYGTPATLDPAKDGILVVERPDVTVAYAHDGARSGGAPGTIGGLKRVAKSGRHGTVTLAHEAAGAGAAYSATVFPSPHVLLRGAGFDAAFSTTKWTYTPTAEGAGYAALTLEAYARGQKAALTGAYGQVKIEGETGAVPRWEFEYQGIMDALPTDIALPAITYGDAQIVDPAKADAMTLTLGTFVPLRVKSFAFAMERGIGARALDNSTNRHGGFNPGGELSCTLEVVVEATALASASPYHTANTFNPYQLAELGTALAISLKVGGTANKRWTLTAPAAQLAADPDQDENNAALWGLSFELKPTTVTASDMVSLVFD